MSTADVVVRNLEQSLKANDVGAVCALLRQIETTRNDKVPVPTLKYIIENVDDADVCDLSLRILIYMASRKGEAMEAITGYMHIETPDKIRFPVVTLLEQRGLSRQFLAIPPDLFYELLIDPVEKIKDATLSMLEQIATISPGRIPSGALTMAILREKNPTMRDKMLRLSEKAYPQNQRIKMVTIDAQYLLNWLRSSVGLRSNGFHEATIEIRKNCLDNSQRDDEVSRLMTESNVLDAFLFMTRKRYRGHQIHQFNVASFGFFLLRTYISESETLAEYIARLKHLPSKDIERAWLISALLHDHAHPIVYLFQNISVMSDLLKAYPTHDTALKSMQKAFEDAYRRLFSTKLSEIYDEYKRNKDKKDKDSEPILYRQLSNIIQEELNRIKCPLEFDRSMLFDHGVLGAVNFTTRLQDISASFVDSDEAIKMAANAIALHNSTTPHISKTKVRLDQEPIAFLLILCDEAQEWGREVWKEEAGFQKLTVECPWIEIGPFSYPNNRRMFPDDLLINFCFPDEETLKSTGWSRELFNESKKRAFQERLAPMDNDVRPKTLHYAIHTGPIP